MLTLPIAAISLTQVVPVFVFLGVLAFFWFVVDFFSRDAKGNAEVRLDSLNERMRVAMEPDPGDRNS